MCDTTHSYVWHDSFTWLIHMCDMTPLCMWHDSFICVIWLLHMCDMTPLCVWLDSFIRVTWLIHMCDMTLYTYDMTHSCVWHDSFTCVTWLIRMCDMTHSYVCDCDTDRHFSEVTNIWMRHATHMNECVSHTYECDIDRSYVWHDSFTCVKRFLHIHDMTHSYVRHDSFIYSCLLHSLTFRCSIYHTMRASHLRMWYGSLTCVTGLLHICDTSHSYVWHDSFICSWLLHSPTFPCSIHHTYVSLKHSNVI